MSQDPDIGSDVQPGCLAPRDRYDLFGHETAETSFARAWESGRLHHAWMITGPKGVGKATLAWRAARRILGAAPDAAFGPLGASPQDPVCKLLEAQSNPDLLLLRPPWDDKRKRWRAEITVEEARKAPHFFEKSSGAKGGWRVCIVDSADDMNTNAANAILKTLEEPPQRGVLFLVTHTPGRLPATIRSRCRRLDLRAPTPEQTTQWLTREHAIAGPDAEAAARLAHGAPGRALALSVSGGVALARDVQSALARGATLAEPEMRTLADRISGKGGEALRGLFYEALAQGLRDQARQRAAAGEDVTGWLKAWRDLAALVRDADALYLDPKQTALTALGLARNAARKETV
ncbi:DNA polymerase III subunit delta' [Maricaulis parjimensis]|uniref:DNA polymerase III subunit delta' n=1 Tax=Maricaulis parjimensis TaxID=144023 RepID=UPI0019393616|nr:DNA polymerase III subunit delta' [Maricaulis parjimensis]